MYLYFQIKSNQIKSNQKLYFTRVARDSGEIEISNKSILLNIYFGFPLEGRKPQAFVVNNLIQHNYKTKYGKYLLPVVYASILP